MKETMIYHMTLNSEWLLAGERGWYEAPSLEREGFIHCSYKEQVSDTANRYYNAALLRTQGTGLSRPKKSPG